MLLYTFVHACIIMYYSVVLVKRSHFSFSYSKFLDSENNFGLVYFESPVLTVVLVSCSFNY